MSAAISIDFTTKELTLTERQPAKWRSKRSQTILISRSYAPKYSRIACLHRTRSISTCRWSIICARLDICHSLEGFTRRALRTQRTTLRAIISSYTPLRSPWTKHPWPLRCRRMRTKYLRTSSIAKLADTQTVPPGWKLNWSNREMRWWRSSTRTMKCSTLRIKCVGWRVQTSQSTLSPIPTHQLSKPLQLSSPTHHVRETLPIRRTIERTICRVRKAWVDITSRKRSLRCHTLIHDRILRRSELLVVW